MITLKVTVIYGNEKENNIYKYTHFLLDNLQNQIPIELTEFFLPEDFYNCCKKCCKCLIKNYNTCHSYCINNIKKSTSDSDLIIFTYSKESTPLLKASLKSLINNLSYMWMPHKINIPMSEKIGIILSDNSIPFINSTPKILKKHFKFWGIKNIINCNLHKTSQPLTEKSVVSKNYLALILLSEKIIRIVSSDISLSLLNSKKLIKFSYSKIERNKNTYRYKYSINKIIPMKRNQNNHSKIL